MTKILLTVVTVATLNISLLNTSFAEGGYTGSGASTINNKLSDEFYPELNAPEEKYKKTLIKETAQELREIWSFISKRTLGQYGEAVAKNFSLQFDLYQPKKLSGKDPIHFNREQKAKPIAYTYKALSKTSSVLKMNTIVEVKPRFFKLSSVTQAFILTHELLHHALGTTKHDHISLFMKHLMITYREYKKQKKLSLQDIKNLKNKALDNITFFSSSRLQSLLYELGWVKSELYVYRFGGGLISDIKTSPKRFLYISLDSYVQYTDSSENNTENLILTNSRITGDLWGCQNSAFVNVSNFPTSELVLIDCVGNNNTFELTRGKKQFFDFGNHHLKLKGDSNYLKLVNSFGFLEVKGDNNRIVQYVNSGSITIEGSNNIIDNSLSGRNSREYYNLEIKGDSNILKDLYLKSSLHILASKAELYSLKLDLSKAFYLRRTKPIQVEGLSLISTNQLNAYNCRFYISDSSNSFLDFSTGRPYVFDAQSCSDMTLFFVPLNPLVMPVVWLFVDGAQDFYGVADVAAGARYYGIESVQGLSETIDELNSIDADDSSEEWE